MTVATTSKTILTILAKNGLVDAETLAKAEVQAQAEGVRLEKYLTENKLVSPENMALALSEYLKIPPISLARFTPNKALSELIPHELMLKKLILPLARIGKTLTVALGDPFDLPAIDEIASMTGLEIVPVVAPESQIYLTVSQLSGNTGKGLDIEEIMKDLESEVEIVEEAGEDEEVNLDEMLESAEGAPVVRMVNMILVEALRTGASDIHIEPAEKKVRLRYRIDGSLVEQPGPPKNLQAAVISRIKIMADLDIAERRKPQDGRFNIKALGREVDLRVSTLPTVHGEKVVLRILDKSTLAPSLSALGLDKKSEELMAAAIRQPHGIILVTGPTGSGKTTTLYSCLQDLNKPDVNIITCEDPVEYQIDGINQTQVHPEVGLTFATALRSILRQDPDIILVGEIRDQETAEIAVRAAITGHLVLSTLHTNDAPGAVTRLSDMGIEPFMIGASLILAQAQRLFRKLCPVCKQETKLSSEILAQNHIDPVFFEAAKIYRAVGCPRCSNGYKGRSAIMEVLPVTPLIREAILKGADAGELRKLGQQLGMMTLKDAALMRVKEGVTSLEEALEVTGAD